MTLSHSQNYINNKALVDKMLSQVDFKPADLILEIGPGTGIITDQLIKKNKIITAVEADKQLFWQLKLKYQSFKNIKLINQNFLEYTLPSKPFIIISNIPFNITADIIRKITNPKSNLQAAYLILQKEAAIKFIGPPKAHSPLWSHFLNINFEIKSLMPINRNNYSPKPKFDTTLLLIKKRTKPVLDNQQSEQFKNFLVYLFESRKGDIKNALKKLMSNLQVKITLKNLNMPEQTELKKIMFNDWLTIFDVFMQHASDQSKRVIAGKYKKLLKEQSKLHKIHRTRRDI